MKKFFASLKEKISGNSNTEISTDLPRTEEVNSEFVAPLQGELKLISEVPDAVFAEKMMGDGFAIVPSGGTVVSPVKGEIVNIFPTKHAIGILSEDGVEILIHFGIDTVKLNGEGFEAFVKQGDKVEQGQKLLEVNVDYVANHAAATITPIVFTNLKADQQLVISTVGSVKLGQTNIITIK